MILIIIDANTWPLVFIENLKEHKNFSAIKKRINSRHVSLAWGGTHYIKEMKKCSNFLNIYSELDRRRQLKKFNSESIDERAIKIKKIEPKIKFNDPHIIALQIESKASIICTKDKESHPFLTNKSLYPKGHSLASIYSNYKHKHLLFIST